MRFQVYVHFRTLKDYEQGLPITGYPVAKSDHDVPITVDLKKVYIMGNQSGIYIEKKTFKKKVKRFFARFKRKGVK